MQFSRSIAPIALAILMAACRESVAPGPAPIATLSGVVKAAAGNVIAGASVKVGNTTVVTDAEGKFAFQDLPVGSTQVTVSATDFDPKWQLMILAEGNNSLEVILSPVDLGVWGLRANMLENNSEFALAAANGKLYVLGGYPPWMGPNRTQRTVQVYDIASNTWQLGPPLPEPNNHGMAATVNGKIYLLGGQYTDNQDGLTAVNTVYELDPAVGAWVTKAPMPTARSGGAAVAYNGRIYVAGGRVPRGNDFAVFDPAANQWEVLPPLPSQRNHITGAAINGRIHILGGRLGNGLSPLKSDAHEVFDPVTKEWTVVAPMIRARSGMNSAMALGCLHVWGGEAPTGMTPDHDYYDPRTNKWFSLKNMPIPIHGVVGSAFVDGLIWVTGGGTNVGGAWGSLYNQTYKPAVSCE